MTAGTWSGGEVGADDECVEQKKKFKDLYLPAEWPNAAVVSLARAAVVRVFAEQ